MTGILNDTKIRKLKSKDKDYTEKDGQGLQLLIKKDGSKLWEFRYSSPTLLDKNGNKKRRKTSFGNYPATSLKLAREKRNIYHQLINSGVDPIEKKREDKHQQIIQENNNFKVIAEQWLDFEQKRLTNKAFVRKRAIVVNDAYPYLQNKQMDLITNKDIINVIEARLSKKIHNSKNNNNPATGIETTNKLFNYLNTIFKFAITKGIIERNPFDNILKDLLIPKPNVVHFPKITDEKELAQLINDVYHYNGHYSTVNALKLVAHIPLRADNLVNLLWEYIDFEENSLTVPRHILKIKDNQLPDLKIPLSNEVIKILKEQYKFTSHQEYVFLSVKGKPLESNTPNIALKRLGYGNRQTTHGFRGTFRSLAETHQNEHKVEEVVKERFLDHNEDDKTKKAYKHKADYYEQMKPLVEWWSNFLINKLKDN